MEIKNNQFEIYENAVYSLERSICNLYKIFNYGIPIEHELKFELLNTIHLKLNKVVEILKKFTIWNKKISTSKYLSLKNLLNCEQLIFFITNPTPSKLLEKLENTFIEIDPLINELISLENNILGTAIRINHPILQKAWMMMGENQLNDTVIPKRILIDNLYSMLLKEQKGCIPNKKYAMSKITDFVSKLDEIIISSPDDNISITELNEYPITEENSASVKKLIDITEFDTDLNIDYDSLKKIFHGTLQKELTNRRKKSFSHTNNNKIYVENQRLIHSR
jgi:hypothetical protein